MHYIGQKESWYGFPNQLAILNPYLLPLSQLFDDLFGTIKKDSLAIYLFSEICETNRVGIWFQSKVASSRPVYTIQFLIIFGVLLTKTCYYPRRATIAMSSKQSTVIYHDLLYFWKLMEWIPSFFHANAFSCIEIEKILIVILEEFLLISWLIAGHGNSSTSRIVARLG